ncbi:hypothetical protein WSM22_04970 [Cytophagales bacterium WSM2-2]|nr:hypothetical protein WSM22_04970 [Cytophagales bacterium WSM2-2]
MQNKKLGFFIGIAMVMVPFLAKSQSNSLGDRAPATVLEQQKTVHKQRVTKKQRLLFRRPNVKHSAEYEFYKRIELVAKEKQRKLRKLAKPQYSNFLYFGHKNPPKKHLPYQMKYCKECGIRH